MTLAYLNIEIDVGKAGLSIQEADRRVNQALSNSIMPILDFIEASQVHLYTQDANPVKPAGSPYQRTFNLRESSEKIHNPGSLDGLWQATIDYSQYVIGTKEEQALIHRGRWLATEDVEQLAINEAETIILEQVSKI